MTVDELTPQEIAAALAARRELGPEYEHEIAASLADKVQRRIDETVASAVASAASAVSAKDAVEVADAVSARWTALGSLAAGTAITLGCTGPGSTPAVVPIAWAGIMVINVAVNRGRRRRRVRA